MKGSYNLSIHCYLDSNWISLRLSRSSLRSRLRFTIPIAWLTRLIPAVNTVMLIL
jgi:hypothetical protein